MAVKTCLQPVDPFASHKPARDGRISGNTVVFDDSPRPCVIVQGGPDQVSVRIVRDRSPHQ
jgi:hypothetical protein